MIWPFVKQKNPPTDDELEEKQKRSDRARRELDLMHARLERACEQLTANRSSLIQ